MLKIAENVSKKDGYALLDFWAIGVKRRDYSKVNIAWANSFKYRSCNWSFRSNGRMDIWLADKLEKVKTA